MANELDPYHRWLGIRPEEQPPNHYRLLGLALYEDDPDVIRDAAERQMGHVRRYALGPYSQLSQRLLNELGTAKSCLLDGRRRAQYDDGLRRRSTVASPTSLSPTTAPVEPSIPVTASDVPAKPNYLVPVAVGLAGTIVLLGLFLLLTHALKPTPHAQGPAPSTSPASQAKPSRPQAPLPRYPPSRSRHSLRPRPSRLPRNLRSRQPCQRRRRKRRQPGKSRRRHRRPRRPRRSHPCRNRRRLVRRPPSRPPWRASSTAPGSRSARCNKTWVR
jgi:hypothetical protein